MAVITEYKTINLPVVYDPDGSYPFVDIACEILGPSVVQQETVYVYDDEDPEDSMTEVSYYVIKDQSVNMVASISWSLFLSVTLLVFGLMRGIFNAVRGGD